MKGGAKLSIHCESLVGSPTKVLLDGMDIGHCLQGVELSLAVADITHATLRILVNELDVSAETMLLLQAYVKKKEEDHNHGLKA